MRRVARKRRPRRLEHEALRRTAHKDGTYERLLKEQNGVCAICGRDNNSYTVRKTGEVKQRKFDIDHCHKRMVVRGALCRSCNLKLRYQLTIEWLEAAAQYLRKHADG